MSPQMIFEAGLEDDPKNHMALTHDYYDESAIGQRRKPRYYQEKAVNNAIKAYLVFDIFWSGES